MTSGKATVDELRSAIASVEALVGYGQLLMCWRHLFCRCTGSWHLTHLTRIVVRGIKYRRPGKLTQRFLLEHGTPFAI